MTTDIPTPIPTAVALPLIRDRAERLAVRSADRFGDAHALTNVVLDLVIVVEQLSRQLEEKS